MPRTLEKPRTATLASPETAVRQRVAAVDWDRVSEDLDAQGFSVVRGLLGAKDCRSVASLYPDDTRFRSHIVMARHGFGRGEYKYFSYPLPPLVVTLRVALYERLAPLANAWNEAMGLAVRYPAAHQDFVERCHAAGQTRPTPLL